MKSNILENQEIREKLSNALSNYEFDHDYDENHNITPIEEKKEVFTFPDIITGYASQYNSESAISEGFSLVAENENEIALLKSTYWHYEDVDNFQKIKSFNIETKENKEIAKAEAFNAYYHHARAVEKESKEEELDNELAYHAQSSPTEKEKLDLTKLFINRYLYLKDEVNRLNVDIKSNNLPTLNLKETLLHETLDMERSASDVILRTEKSFREQSNIKDFDEKELAQEAKQFKEFSSIEKIISTVRYTNKEIDKQSLDTVGPIKLDSISERIAYVSTKHYESKDEAMKVLLQVQQKYKEKTFAELSKAHPDLKKYDDLFKKRQVVSPLKSKIIDKKMLEVAKKINSNKQIKTLIKSKLPTLAKTLSNQLKREKDMNRGRAM